MRAPQAIDGRTPVAAHGPATAPVWGEVFHGRESDVRGKVVRA